MSCWTAAAASVWSAGASICWCGPILRPSGVRRGGIRDDVQEVARLLERVTGGNLSAVELYRLQYLVGMLQVQASSGSKVSQQAGQGIESLLKQQG